MEIREMTIEQIEERGVKIKEELSAEDVTAETVEKLHSEMDELEARKSVLAEEAKKAEEARAAAAKETVTIKSFEEEERKEMENIEIRNTREYIDAFASYIKTGKDTECRALLTENATGGSLPVPELVEKTVRTAWENEGIMSRVKTSFIKGNLKVGFELSATGAVVHDEAANSKPDEETLVIGVVELVPKSIKKWITISDEALDLDSGAFLQYVYNEVAYQIAKKAADELVAKIIACGTVATNTPSVDPGVPSITATTVSVGLIAKAIAQLSDQASNPVIMMNKQTWADFKEAQYANKFSVDPFEGLDVVFNNTITAFSAATTGVPYVIVGDLGYGALANFPAGQTITFKYDDMSLAEYDLAKIVGREFVGMGVVAPKAFCTIEH